MAPVLEFQHEGRTFRFRDAVCSNPPGYEKGDVVRVLYDPFRPTRARVDRDSWNFGFPLLVTVIGAAFSLVGIVSVRSRGSMFAESS